MTGPGNTMMDENSPFKLQNLKSHGEAIRKCEKNYGKC